MPRSSSRRQHHQRRQQGGDEYEDTNSANEYEYDYDDEYDDEEESSSSVPIFEIVEHPFKVSRRKGFTLRSLAVGNDIMAIGSAEGSILVAPVDSPDFGTMDELVISPRVPVTFLSIDPSGTHLIVCMEDGTNYYVHTTKLRKKPLKSSSSSSSSVYITCAAWDRQSSATSAFAILGSASGALYLLPSVDQIPSLTLVFQITNQGPITGIEFEHWKVRDLNSSYYIMLTTSDIDRPTRLYQFTGSSSIESVFRSYDSADKLRFQDLPGSVLNATINFYRKRPREKARAFGILTGDGVFFGNLNFQSSDNSNNVMSSTGLVSSSSSESSTEDFSSSVVQMCLTEFHIVICYETRVCVINKLNNVTILENTFDSRIGTVEGITRDSLSHNNLWIFSDRRINEVLVTDEDRDVWKLYMQKAVRNGSERDFEAALVKCKEDESAKDVVLTAQADYYFDIAQEFTKAAGIYAKTTTSSTRSFEEIALKFVTSNQKSALITFLSLRIKTIPSRYKTQLTVLCTWLVELYLDQFDTTEDLNSRAQVLFEFKQFLKDYKRHLNQSTTFNLIASHGRAEELVFYANLVQNYEKVVAFHMQKGDYKSALTILSSSNNSRGVSELFYKYSSELILVHPVLTVEAWKTCSSLNPSRLIPAIVKYVKNHRNNTDLVIDYLSSVVVKRTRGDDDSTINNYLLYLYATHPDERSLIRFLRRKQSGKSSCFDLTYALRLCTTHEKSRACIYLYSAMGLYVEAVEKALTVDVAVAKEVATQPEDTELQRKLWILITKHVIDAGGEISDALEIVKESDSVIKIEDILPFVPDFAVINDFKSEICKSLEKYNDRIDTLKSEMRDFSDSAETIRTDLNSLRSRVMMISGSQKCDLSGENILDDEFYVFPCGHAFLASALVSYVSSFYLNSFEKQNVKELVATLQRLDNTLMSSSSSSSALSSITSLLKRKEENGIKREVSASSSSERQEIQEKLDDIVASECIYCGDFMIKSITMPFVSMEEEKLEAADWVL